MPRNSNAPAIKAIIASLRDVGQFMPIPDFNRRQAADALEQLLGDVSYLNSLLDSKCLEILDLHDRLTQANEERRLAVAALSEECDRYKAALDQLKNRKPATYDFLIQWKDQSPATYGDPPYSVEIAACENEDDHEDDLSIFFYAGYLTREQIMQKYSRDNSPEDWYILTDDQVCWCDNCGDAIEIGKQRPHSSMPAPTSSTNVGESAILCCRCSHFIDNNTDYMGGRDVL